MGGREGREEEKGEVGTCRWKPVIHLISMSTQSERGGGGGGKGGGSYIFI